MEYFKLNNGNLIPKLGLGTWDLRGEIGKKSILDALELGYRLIDTAKMYQNEDIVGKALSESGIKRDEIFITTKLHAPYNNYAKVNEGIEQSLNDLRIDYIDLLLIHEPYPYALEMYKAFEDAYKKGKVKAIGLSNFNKEQYLNFISNCEIVPAVNQVESHIYYPQFDLIEIFNSHGTHMQSWGPFTEGRKNLFKEPILLKIASSYEKSVAQISLRYLVQNGVIVIPKSQHKKRLKENIDIFDFSLTESDMKEILKLNTNRSLFGWY